jgi:hypothetical protein
MTSTGSAAFSSFFTWLIARLPELGQTFMVIDGGPGPRPESVDAGSDPHMSRDARGFAPTPCLISVV